MSGCHNPVSVKNNCIHGIALSILPCDLCDLSKRIEKLEQAYQADAETCKEIIFAGAQNHAIILKCEEKIKELENKYNASTEVEQILLNRIKELERFQEITQLQYQQRNKTPYKCPVCDGEGKIRLGSAQILLSDPPQHPTKACESCVGKGIVWG